MSRDPEQPEGLREYYPFRYPPCVSLVTGIGQNPAALMAFNWPSSIGRTIHAELVSSWFRRRYLFAIDANLFHAVNFHQISIFIWYKKWRRYLVNCQVRVICYNSLIYFWWFQEWYNKYFPWRFCIFLRVMRIPYISTRLINSAFGKYQSHRIS